MGLNKMSTKPNYRRNTPRFQDNGPRWEGSPNQGGHGIAKGRKRFKKFRNRKERRSIWQEVILRS